MTRRVEPGRRVAVRVPASSANLGPGFDSLGLALDLVDEVEVTVLEDGCEVVVEGEGAGTVPRDRSHLVVATLLDALAGWDVELLGLRLEARNVIPHGRGLGSSSAALVAGLLAAWGLAHPGVPVDRDWLLQRSNALEGHADNVAATICGGLVLTWSDTPGGRASVCSGRLVEGLRTLALVPRSVVLTEHARRVLPTEVAHRDAAANTGRAALLVHALATDPDLLLPATRDWLHQDARAGLMPEADRLRRALREAGFAAVVSGAGPTVLVLAGAQHHEPLRQWLESATGRELTDGFAALPLAVGGGAVLEVDPVR
ncbi:homoserine kinase [Desertihabitans aurantiacus]|uniref:homoserine kinase n=1 Tax=Desertihabitans aurantiacus TaxID=2282477 RepID=UPI000DF864FF|nr:homoserine kinase [Desertihabitans aurantiacus]